MKINSNFDYFADGIDVESTLILERSPKMSNYEPVSRFPLDSTAITC